MPEEFYISEVVGANLVQITPIKGKHIFAAMTNMSKNKTHFIAELAAQVVHVNNQPVTISFLEESDDTKLIMFITECLGNMLDNNLKL